jgi:hypothetical protein
MTNRNETKLPSPPSEARLLAARGAGLAAIALAAAVAVAPLAGCGGEEEQAAVAPAPPPPPPPPPPEAPKVTPVAQLMKELGISPKIRMQEDQAPDTDPERVAVLRFFDAFAKSAPQGIAPALSPIDRATLEASMRGDALKRECDAVSRVDLFASSSLSDLRKGDDGKDASAWPEDAPTKDAGCVMAVFRAGGRTEAQLWVFEVQGEGRKVAKQVFHSVYQPQDVMSKVSGSSLRSAWMALVRKELAVASLPDEALKPVARVETQEAPERSREGGTSGPMGMPPMRNRPKPGSVDPPKNFPTR